MVFNKETIMNYSKQLSSLIVLVFIIFSTSTFADWDSLLNDLPLAGKELLSTNDNPTSLDNNTIVSGLKEALDTASHRAIDSISQQDGYLSNDLIHIEMPPQLQQVSGLMRNFGLSSQAEQFENSMNHAAEKAAPQATTLIVDAINDMSIEDANNILHGADDAATLYFRDKTSAQLTELFRPTIENSLNTVGTTKYYNDLTAQVADIPLAGETVNLDLPDYVTEQALDGLFSMIAVEEKKIRDDPAARTTELLKQVFGTN